MGPVKWLLQNFEIAQGVSIPRSTLYSLYLCYCKKNNLKPITAASLGKIISNVFVCLRTRRLGKRGNTKYHYHGIRVIPGSEVSQLLDEKNVALCQEPSQKHHKFLTYSNNSGSENLKIKNEYGQNTKPSLDSQHSNSIPQDPHQHLHLSDISGAVHDFPNIKYPTAHHLPQDCTLEDMVIFRHIYREHCCAILNAVANFEFQTVENLWREFWQSQDDNYGDVCDSDKYLSKRKLYLLCKCGPVQEFVQCVDCLLHKFVIDVLIPDVLMAIPTSAIKAIQNFSKGLESCLKKAMKNYPEEIVNIKVSAASALAQMLQRYTSLNQMAQAAHSVFQNSSLIHQMLVDINEFDFCRMHVQASLVCHIDDSMVQQLEVDFKKMLQEQKSLQQWTAWLKGVVSQVLTPYENKSDLIKAARQLFLSWSFYSSMVIRDLALKSAASFGCFHVIHLLFNEYIFFVIENILANGTEGTSETQ
jgi:regulatory factor X 1/2/3